MKTKLEGIQNPTGYREIEHTKKLIHLWISLWTVVENNEKKYINGATHERG